MGVIHRGAGSAGAGAPARRGCRPRRRGRGACRHRSACARRRCRASRRDGASRSAMPAPRRGKGGARDGSGSRSRPILGNMVPGQRHRARTAKRLPIRRARWPKRRRIRRLHSAGNPAQADPRAMSRDPGCIIIIPRSGRSGMAVERPIERLASALQDCLDDRAEEAL